MPVPPHVLVGFRGFIGAVGRLKGLPDLSILWEPLSTSVTLCSQWEITYIQGFSLLIRSSLAEELGQEEGKY